MEIPRLPKSELKELVIRFLAGDIFFSAQVREPDLVKMVFLPLALGMFSYPVEAPKHTGKPVLPVSKPVRPVRGVVDLGGAQAELDQRERILREDIALVGFRLRWASSSDEEETSEKEVQVLMDNLASVVRERADLLQNVTKLVDEQHRQDRETYLTELKAYRVARREWRAAVAEWEVGEREFEERCRVWENGNRIWYECIKRDLGTVYAPVKDAGPRSINGYPIFWSCSALHRKDWDLVRKLIDRELARMRGIEIGDDEEVML